MIGQEKSDDRPKRGRQWPRGVVFNRTPGAQPPAGLAPGKSPIADRLYQELRQMILYGEIQPGEWLRQEVITVQFGVSRTPVREVLRVLEQEGLVELIPNYGARASLLSMDEFEELYALRCGIEGLAARLSVMKLTPERMISLRERFNLLIPLANQENLQQYLRDEWAFRYFLFEATGRSRLLEMVRMYRERAERYLRYAYTVEGRVNESLSFHQMLLDACVRVDPEAAERVVVSALRWTLEKAGPIISTGIGNT